MEEKAIQYVDPAKKPYPFCPGCSHSLILDAIDRSLQINRADPKRTLLVSDIGCIGMSDRFFDVHTLHGLHGRSFTYASGAKLADPDLNVFVLVGDGGVGIGGNHLIHAARRNIGITVIVFNNYNFGMTGGQHSATTPLKGITSTTPEGNIDNPLDVASLAKATGATFVARVTAFDRDLDRIIAEGMRHKGFALIEVLELCTAYYSPRNDFKKSELEAKIQELPGASGVLQNIEKPEYSQRLRDFFTPEKQSFEFKGIEKMFEHNLPGNEYDLILAGSAGMKIVTAAANLGNAGLLCGLWVSQQDDYPVTVQSGHSVSMLKFSREKINHTSIDNPRGAIVISDLGLNEVKDELASMPADGLVIADAGLDIKTPARVVKVDFKAAKLNRMNTISAALALFLMLSGIIPLEALRETVNRIPKEKIRLENMKSIEDALKIYEKLGI